MKRTNAIETYFETIDNQEKAYYLGLITADGCIIQQSHPKYHIQDKLVLTLQERDGYILNRLYEEIIPHKKVRITDMSKYENFSNRAVFQVVSDKISKDLEMYNIYPRKSGKETFPSLPSEYVRHFIRGFFDGDGCVYLKHTNKKSKTGGQIKIVVTFICLKREFLESLKDHLGYGRIYERKKKGNRQNVFALEIDKKDDTVTFFNYLYKDSIIHLHRKFEKFIQGNPVLTSSITTTSSVETSD